MVDVPPEIMDHYQAVTLCADIMFVNSIPFFMSISKHIKFTTSSFIPNHKEPAILLAFKDVYRFYRQRRFKIVAAHMDLEFEPLRGSSQT